MPKSNKKAIDLSDQPSTSFLSTIKNLPTEAPELLFGAHAELKYYKFWKNKPELFGNAIQFFYKSPRSYAIKNLSEDEIVVFKEALKELKWVNVHSPYILNFARPRTADSKEMKCLINDLENLQKIHPRPSETGCVLHLGKNVKDLEISDKKARRNMAKAVRMAISETPECQVKVIIETSCNQGTEICWKMEKLGKLYKEIVTVPGSDPPVIDPVIDQRIGFCIDTAHIWSAGYDLRTADDVNRFAHHFQKEIGWNKVSLIHFNDSKQEVHCCADRHESIGKGYIGDSTKGGSLDGFKELVKICHHTGKPMVLETCGPYTDEIEMVNSWEK